LVLGLVAIVAGIFGTLGYLGLVLDDTRRAEARAREAQTTEAAARAAAESVAEELRAALAQRDQLAAERQRTLEVLAHEIRQPLNNAGSALQATASVLHGMEGPGAEQAAARLQRARAVLGNVNSVLDNTLAVAQLLALHRPLPLQEVELDLLVDLVLGDLNEAQRERVQVRRLADMRTAEVETGLMRLALRNLLLNALKHGGPAAHVELRLTEREDPPALLLCVADDGPGMEPAQMRAAQIKAADDPQPPRRGLGLYIARTVALRHGGRLHLSAVAPHGLRVCLELPLPG
jgi:signal transduction histidine kinase